MYTNAPVTKTEHSIKQNLAQLWHQLSRNSTIYKLNYSPDIYSHIVAPKPITKKMKKEHTLARSQARYHNITRMGINLFIRLNLTLKSVFM